MCNIKFGKNWNQLKTKSQCCSNKPHVLWGFMSQHTAALSCCWGVQAAFNLPAFIQTVWKYHVGKGWWKHSLEVVYGLVHKTGNAQIGRQEQSRRIGCKITVGCQFKLKAFDLGELFRDRLNLTAIKTLHFPISQVLLPWWWHGWVNFVGSTTCNNY